MAAPIPPPPDALFAASHKVYLFLCGKSMNFEDRDDYVEDVYMLDLYPNAKGNPNSIPSVYADSITVAPALRFKSDFPVARIVLDSKLYLFEGVEKFSVDAKSVHVYDLSTASSYLPIGVGVGAEAVEPQVVLIDKMLSLPPMHGLKRHPSAILTPDRKHILVFSMFVKQFTFDPKVAEYTIGMEGFVDFELFDHVNESWLELPPLPDLPRAKNKSRVIMIQSYYFKGATFVLRTRESITFSLDLNDLKKGWEVGDIARTHPLNGEVVPVGDALAVSMNRVYDVAGDFWYHVSENANVKNASFMPMMAVLDHCLRGDWENQVCMLFLDHDSEGALLKIRGNTTVFPEIYIDVYELKYPGCVSKSRRTLTPSKMRSHKFDLSVPYSSFFLISLLPARATTH